jgi:flagellar hook protein FlgE
MMRSLFSAISGLRNHMTYMDVIGNNIANVNTIAFKSSRVNFQEVLVQTLRGASSPQDDLGGANPLQIGLGMKIGSIDVLQTQGSLQTTGKLTDFAIQGDGFFVLSDGQKNVYTRDGSFDVAVNGDLVSPVTGWKVQGWSVAPGGTIDTLSPVSTINIPFGSAMAANATSTMRLAGNLNASAPFGSATNTTVNVYDSLGNLHSVKMAFTHTAAGEWTVTDALSVTATLAGGGTGSLASISGQPADLRPGTYAVTTTASGDISYVFTPTGGPAEAAVSGTITAGGTNTTLIPGLTLTANGALTNGTHTITVGGGTAIDFGTDGAYVTSNPAISLNLTPGGGAESPQNVAINLAEVTSFAGEGTVNTESQDGFAAGSLVTFSVSASGEITGIFSNGSNHVIGQVALATFTNPGGLSRGGDNMMEATSNSGEARIGAANTEGRGTVSSGVLEGSNVDLAQQFTNVIIAQRGFQASSRVITASDEMLNELVNIRR